MTDHTLSFEVPNTVQSLASRSILLWTGVAFVATILVAFASSAIVGTYPIACGRCHASAGFVEATEQSAHAAQSCTRCHGSGGPVARLAFGSRVVFGMVLHLTPVGGRSVAHVPDPTCTGCHESAMEGVIYANGRRILHEECARGSTCTDCHSTTAHGTQIAWPRTAQMDGCLECHATEDVFEGCDTCHDPRTPRERLGTGPWVNTHGAGWQTTHGMGDGTTCAACHPDGYCVRCHGIDLPHGDDFINRHSTDANADPAACDSCHDRETFCRDCHGIEMPHPASFATDHPGLVETGGEEACRRCHTQKDCDTCHEAHVHPGGATPTGPPVLRQRGGSR